jgi:hypothetical protein
MQVRLGQAAQIGDRLHRRAAEACLGEDALGGIENRALDIFARAGPGALFFSVFRLRHGRFPGLPNDLD